MYLIMKCDYSSQMHSLEPASALDLVLMPRNNDWVNKVKNVS